MQERNNFNFQMDQLLDVESLKKLTPEQKNQVISGIKQQAAIENAQQLITVCFLSFRQLLTLKNMYLLLSKKKTKWRLQHDLFKGAKLFAEYTVNILPTIFSGLTKNQNFCLWYFFDSAKFRLFPRSAQASALQVPGARWVEVRSSVCNGVWIDLSKVGTSYQWRCRSACSMRVHMPLHPLLHHYLAV